ncbi:MAG: hypothetical protein JW717_07020 [Marinilabiliaceae bacterium]|nr:hypothetical protein [Marinilabiliaceae bacterium]
MKCIISLLIIISICFFQGLSGQNKQYQNMLVNDDYVSLVSQIDSLPIKEWSQNEYLLKAVALDKLGKSTESVQTLIKGTESFVNNKDLQIKLASTYYNLGDYTLAKPLLDSIVIRYPDYFPAAYQLAHILSFTRKYSQSVDLMYEWYLKDSANIICLTSLSDDYKQIDSVSQSIKYCEKILALSPGNQKVALKLCHLYSEVKNFEKSIEICDEVLSKDSLNLRFLQNKGSSLFKLENFEAANTIYDLLISNGDSSLYTLRYHGLTKYKIGDYKKAISSLTIVYDNLPQDFTSSWYLAKAYAKIEGKGKMALEYYNLTLELLNNDGNIALIYSQMADVYLYLKDFENSQRYYKYALSTEPEQTNNLYALATLNDYHINNKKDALLYYNRYIDAIKKDTVEQDSASNRFKQRDATFRFSKRRVVKLKEELFFKGK